MKGMLSWMRGKPQASAESLPARRDPTDERWYGVSSELTAYTPSGVPMTYELALQIPAVLACLTVLSETVAALPIGLFRRLANGDKAPLRDHPLYPTLHHRPNRYQTAFEFRQQMQWDAAFWRNAYALIGDGDRGIGTELHRLNPRRMSVARLADGYRYDYRDEQGSLRRYNDEQIMHLRIAPLIEDGSGGRSMLDTSSHILGQAFAVQEFGSHFFSNYTASGERIIPPASHKWADEESRTNWLRAYVAAATGRNRHKPRLLPNEFKVEKDIVNNEQAQFIETKKEAAYDVARLWRMPPHKIQLLDRATNNNIEHQGLEFVTDTVMPWLVMWEQAFSRDLIVEEDEVFAEHNVAGLLRGDIRSRFAAYAVGRQWGWISVNEIRALENMNSVEGGDQYLRPLNMVDANTADPMGDLDRANAQPGKSTSDEKPADDEKVKGDE